jgi:hypothetical protein
MITVVSGLPRSGTSMMMQMLEAGGLPPLTDRQRAADEDNPRGYYELEQVKDRDVKGAWAADAEGKAVKIISMLLYDLPPGRQYRVIFMRRPMEEILASQAEMLRRRGADPGPADDRMKQHYEAHLRKLDRWMAEQPNIAKLACDYHAALADPRREARAIAGFLGLDLDVEAMARVVEPSLHRQRGA